METIGTDLPKEMARVRDVLMPLYQSIGPAGSFVRECMRADLDFATKALAEADVPAMIAAYNRLKGYKS